MNFRFLLLLLISWPSVSDEISLVFRESHFLSQYRHEIYINTGQYVYIDDHFKLDSESEWIPNTPVLKTKALNTYHQANLINRLIELGVDDWKSEYPESDIALICDGLSFTFYIKSDELNLYTTGGCRFPPNYEEVRKILEDL
ncbi:hypothetical protein J8L84_19975 [Alteromonas sp. MMG017]|uniref:hypothetical protein n=1 Tax=Alteromonas sp. MMG017 TaxID=2822692 RepID=UPI001B3A13C2|nr:hypothetical protein [Alteromonas sp. MMG017]